VNALFQLLSDQEIPTLLEMMREFYAQQEMRFDEPAASQAIHRTLANADLAQIYLIFRGTELAGYFALTFCFSLEFHGRFALFDELYLREPFRRQKLGKAVVAFAEELCKKAGIKAVRHGTQNPVVVSVTEPKVNAEDAAAEAAAAAAAAAAAPAKGKGGKAAPAKAAAPAAKK